MGNPRAKKQSSTTTTGQEVNTKTRKELICTILKKKTKEKFLTVNQKKYYDTLISSEITICSGPAGVGKSYITMKAAVDLLADPTTPYEKIIIVRPAVEAEEKRGQGNDRDNEIDIALLHWDRDGFSSSPWGPSRSSSPRVQRWPRR